MLFRYRARYLKQRIEDRYTRAGTRSIRPGPQRKDDLIYRNEAKNSGLSAKLSLG
jgi:hypothetical protein